MGKTGEWAFGGYVEYFPTKDGYRYIIVEKESGYNVYGRDGKEYYPSKKEAQYNMPDLYGYYVDKCYFG